MLNTIKLCIFILCSDGQNEIKGTGLPHGGKFDFKKTTQRNVAMLSLSSDSKVGANSQTGTETFLKQGIRNIKFISLMMDKICHGHF